MGKRGPKPKPKQKTMEQIREEREQAKLEEDAVRAAKAAAIREGAERIKADRALHNLQETNAFIESQLNKFRSK